MMASALPKPHIDAEDNADLDYPYFVDPKEGRRMFDEAVREAMGISGEEFIRRWEAGEYREIADRPGSLYIGNLIALIPFARQ